MFRWHVVSAVFWRNVQQYFSGVLGYLFIVVFVTVCALMTFSPQFFADNLANLDQLTRWFPILLLFFIPAITMGVWADEKKQGTDAILFTLPGTDFEIILGKYLSVVAVYTVALFFATTQLFALNAIGDPDWGVIGTTFLGYWLSGVALLAIGMFASSLSESPTVAFVLGALFCSIPVVLISFYVPGTVVERFGFDWNLRDFSMGLIPLSNVSYFLLLAGFMLYLNKVVISRRHWNRGQQYSLGGHFLVRIVSLAIGLLALVYVLANYGGLSMARMDLTGEKLFSLDQTTVETLKKARDGDAQVKVQAFISEEVPRKYVNTRKQLMGLLRQYNIYGGSKVDVRLVNVKPNSPQEEEAQRLGITPQADRTDVGGRTVEQDVYIGAYVSSPNDEIVLPFIEGDSSIEYELSHSIAMTLSSKEKITLGILDTDTHFPGPEVNGKRIDWAYRKTLAELKNLYVVTAIDATELSLYLKDEPAAEEIKIEGAEEPKAEEEEKKRTPPQVLLVPDPSSLDSQGMEALVKYVKAGNPVVILADPLPFHWTIQEPREIGVLNAPRMERIGGRSPYRRVLTSSSNPKADAGRANQLFAALGIDWDNGATVWTSFDPHPNFDGLWPEYLGNSWPEYYGPKDKLHVWVRSRGGTEVFNQENQISNGLKELLFFYPGEFKKAPDSATKFEPLITIGEKSGVTPWEMVTKTPKQTTRRIDRETGRIVTTDFAASSQITGGDLVVINPEPRTMMDDSSHVIAAQVSGGPDNVNAVIIADLDFVSDIFHSHEKAVEQPLDNLTFLENAIESLAGKSGFVGLRNRRPNPRTLTQVEFWNEEFRTQREKKQELAQQKNQEELEKDQALLQEAASKIQDDKSLNYYEKLQQTFSEANNVQRRYELRKVKRDKETKREVERLKSEEQQQISGLENKIRNRSVLLAPLPAIILGLFVLITRVNSERKNIAPDRRA